MLSDRDEVVAAFDALDAAWERLAGCKFDALVTGERLALLERLEVQRRRQPAAEHELVNQLRAQATPAELGGRLSHALADRLRISRGEARRRIAAAEQLGSRTALSGAPMEPLLAATAAAQRAGRIGAEQVGVIRALCVGCPAGWMWAPGSWPRRSWSGWPAGFAPSRWPGRRSAGDAAGPRRRLLR